MGNVMDMCIDDQWTRSLLLIQVMAWCLLDINPLPEPLPTKSKCKSQIEENVFENVVYKMPALLFRTQCVATRVHTDVVFALYSCII